MDIIKFISALDSFIRNIFRLLKQICIKCVRQTNKRLGIQTDKLTDDDVNPDEPLCQPASQNWLFNTYVTEMIMVPEDYICFVFKLHFLPTCKYTQTKCSTPKCSTAWAARQSNPSKRRVTNIFKTGKKHCNWSTYLYILHNPLLCDITMLCFHQDVCEFMENHVKWSLVFQWFLKVNLKIGQGHTDKIKVITWR